MEMLGLSTDGLEADAEAEIATKARNRVSQPCHNL
jgi:hypothetical protein